MSKETTSDQLKSTLCQIYGGAAKDWRRDSKKKNAAGQDVREFKNSETGAVLVVTELSDGQFNIKRNGTDDNVNVSLPVSTPVRPSAMIETDPARNAAADKAIAIIMGDEVGDDSVDADNYVPKKIIEAAGKALANRYCFAISKEDDELTAWITPIRYFKENGCCSDQTGPIRGLLPKCGETSESEWEFYDRAVKTPVDAAQHLQQLGFIWNRDFQNYIDSSLTKKLDVWAKSSAPKKAGGNSPKI